MHFFEHGVPCTLQICRRHLFKANYNTIQYKMYPFTVTLRTF